MIILFKFILIITYIQSIPFHILFLHILSQFIPVPQTITPIGMELNPTTEHIEEPYSEKVKKMLDRKGVSYKKDDQSTQEKVEKES